MDYVLVPKWPKSLSGLKYGSKASFATLAAVVFEEF